jgi:hypothetical protein
MKHCAKEKGFSGCPHAERRPHDFVSPEEARPDTMPKVDGTAVPMSEIHRLLAARGGGTL